MDKAKITLRAQYGFSELAQTNWKMMNRSEERRVGKECRSRCKQCAGIF